MKFGKFAAYVVAVIVGGNIVFKKLGWNVPGFRG